MIAEAERLKTVASSSPASNDDDDDDQDYSARKQIFNRDAQATGPDRLRTIYVGDSLTDLAPLLAADTGIIIRDHDDKKHATVGSEQPDFSEALSRIGLRVSWIGEYSDEAAEKTETETVKETKTDRDQEVEVEVEVVASKNGTKPTRLWYAKDFNEILNSGILGLSEPPPPPAIEENGGHHGSEFTEQLIKRNPLFFQSQMARITKVYSLFRSLPASDRWIA